jgi:hypothetical protein
VLWWRPSPETRHSSSACGHAFDTIVFGTDEGPDGLKANIGRFDAFLQADNIPEAVQAKCWSGTLARILDIPVKQEGHPSLRYAIAGAVVTEPENGFRFPGGLKAHLISVEEEHMQARRFVLIALMSIAAAVLSPSPAAAAQDTAYVPDRYHTPQELNAVLAALNRLNPGRTALHGIATTTGGEELTVLEIGAAVGKQPSRVPAVLVVANPEGVTPIASEAAVHLADLILRTPASAGDPTWFILPTANPDAAWRYFRRPLVADERNASKFNDDMDDQADEDGPDDLDGDGIITQMRQRDPGGEWISLGSDPRVMKKADPAKGEKGIYKLYGEGIDNDKDGEYDEDGPGGVNVGITFPHLFKPFTSNGGLWPGSEPETFAIMKFAVDHPEIAMTLTFGESNMCLQAPAGGRQSAFDATAIKIPERYAKMFGVDPTRAYTMQEVMEMIRPMAPPGFEITESMVASFLGLGAVVNPLEDDLKIYRELSERFKEFLKVAKLDAKRLDPPQPKDGSFELWSYYQLGVPTFSMDFWTLPEPKSEEKEKTDITAETLETMTPEAFAALGEKKLAAFLKEVGAPESIKPAEILEGVKSGKITPKQAAGMLRQMPKPKDTDSGDPKIRALIAFSDGEMQGKRFLKWTPFKHPQLGEVEVGGPAPFADTTPPPSMLKALLDGQVPWALKLSERLARLKIQKTEVKASGAGVYDVTIWIENGGYLPFPTAMGKKNQHVGPAVVTLRGDGMTFLGGRNRTPVNEIEGGKAAKLQWLVYSPGGDRMLQVTLESPNAGGDTTQVTLAAGQGGAR